MLIPSAFDAVALAADGDHNREAVRQACEAAQLRVLDLSTDLDPAPFHDARVALRLPVGLATRARKRQLPVRLSAASAYWFAGLPEEFTGRRLAVLTVSQLLQGEVPLPQIRLVKLANGKYRNFAATSTRDAHQAAEAVRAAGLPASSELLVADDYLDCHSEYRTFTAGRQVLAHSPYLVEGESWSPQLTWHKASFHEEAAQFVRQVLRQLDDDDVPPSCVLDVARLPTGKFVLLEVNTSWGAGLYGCDPTGVLQSLLAANMPVSRRWQWQPDAGLLELVPN